MTWARESGRPADEPPPVSEGVVAAIGSRTTQAPGRSAGRTSQLVKRSHRTCTPAALGDRPDLRRPPDRRGVCFITDAFSRMIVELAGRVGPMVEALPRSEDVTWKYRYAGLDMSLGSFSPGASVLRCGERRRDRYGTLYIGSIGDSFDNALRRR